VIQTERRAHTPFTTVWCLKAKGLIPLARMVQLDPTGKRYMWQGSKYGSFMRWYRPRVDPNTDKQKVCRAKFLDACAAWNALTPAQKEVWNRDKKTLRKRIYGWNEFCSRFMKGLI